MTGKGPPLFHLLNGDLCYANLDYAERSGRVARLRRQHRPLGARTGRGCPRSATTRPSSAPATTRATRATAPGGIAAQGAAGNYWNGPYGYGHYLSRFLLPDNDVTNYDGNHLRGNFYAFQVGTVQFISLDADDVIYQDGASAYLEQRPERRAESPRRRRRRSPTAPSPTTTATPATSRIVRGRQLRGAGLQQRHAEPAVHSGSSARWRRPAATRRST